ncbi:unnamed protein product [Lactuca virosa]|uniref:Uncharacterized protein n=1 Tax=Lactuca virosa TaxID=75947 RepID=A0AAU9NM39_9ASTR|nr:unnamed protein product [Lactuca virosa]
MLKDLSHKEHLGIREGKMAEDPLDWNDYKSMKFIRAVIFETSRFATTKEMELNGIKASFTLPKWLAKVKMTRLPLPTFYRLMIEISNREKLKSENSERISSDSSFWMKWFFMGMGLTLGFNPIPTAATFNVFLLCSTYIRFPGWKGRHRCTTGEGKLFFLLSDLLHLRRLRRRLSEVKREDRRKLMGEINQFIRSHFQPESNFFLFSCFISFTKF